MKALKSTIIYLIIASLLLFSCTEHGEETNLSDCPDIYIKPTLQYEGILKGIDHEFLSQTTEQPDQDGALSRNKEGYFSVRFQVNISKLTDLGIKNERIDAIQEFKKALEYSFDYQKPDGSYQLNLPEDLVIDPIIDVPTKGDSVSAIAFFSYALSISLNALNESEWFKNNNEISELKSDIQSFKPMIEKTLNYLKNNVSILRQVDADAPNRLLFDAIAFFGLGKYLDDQEAQDLGMEFLDLALSLIDEDEGYFIESGGWDSSYNGVAVKLGLELFSMMPENHPIKESFGKRLTCAIKWQESRILDSGKISTEGNTRVYSGGETFLGNEKEVDVEKTVRAFYYFSVLSDDESYKELADKILNYYL